MTTSDQSQAAPTSPAPSPEPQDVRQALELQLFDLVELARDTRSDKGGEAKWVHPCGALVKEFAKRIAALTQSDAEPKGLQLVNNGDPICLRDCPEGLFLFNGTLCFKSEYKTEVPGPQWQCDAYVVESGEYFQGGAGSSYERERLVVQPLVATLAQSDAEPAADEEAADALRSEYKTYARQMDRRWAGVHGELIPDCPTEGVAARQGNGG